LALAAGFSGSSPRSKDRWLAPKPLTAMISQRKATIELPWVHALIEVHPGHSRVTKQQRRNDRELREGDCKDDRLAKALKKQVDRYRPGNQDADAVAEVHSSGKEPRLAFKAKAALRTLFMETPECAKDGSLQAARAAKAQNGEQFHGWILGGQAEFTRARSHEPQCTISLAEINDLSKLGHRYGPALVVANLIGKTHRGIFFAVRQKDTGGRLLEMANPTQQGISIGVPRESIDASDLRFRFVVSTVNANFRFAVADQSAERSMGLVSNK